NADALSTAALARTLTADLTFGSITTATTVTASPTSRADGVTVVQINGGITLSNASLILSGSSSDVFLVNVTGSPSFTRTRGLLPGGGVTTNHVLYNFTGNTGTIKSHVGNVFYGTLLAPKYSMSLDGLFVGELIAGGSSIVLLSGAKVESAGQLNNTATGSAT